MWSVVIGKIQKAHTKDPSVYYFKDMAPEYLGGEFPAVEGRSRVRWHGARAGERPSAPALRRSTLRRSVTHPAHAASHNPTNNTPATHHHHRRLRPPPTVSEGFRGCPGWYEDTCCLTWKNAPQASFDTWQAGAGLSKTYATADLFMYSMEVRMYM